MLDFLQLEKELKGTELEDLAQYLSPTFLASINHGDLPRWMETINSAPSASPSALSFSDTIRIGHTEDLSDIDQAALLATLRDFIPWRKGPFNLFGHAIDSEWQCQVKWERVRKLITPLEGKRVLDVGSGNGYYALRMIESGASQVIGIDPHLPYVMQFWLVKKYLKDIPAFVLPLTLEQLPLPVPHFDSVFSMGVLYHRRSPIDHILQLKQCLRKGGELVIESIIVDGAEGYSLTPGKHYARMSNVWFLPSIATLCNWLSKCGFTEIELIDESVTTLAEQRKTDWMPFGSLDDALGDDAATTKEGYPAPKRAVITAIKP